MTSVFAGLLQFAARTGNGKSKNKGNRWVVAPFGLHSGLRQSGGRCAAGPDARAKARAYLISNDNDNDNSNDNSNSNSKGKGKSKDEIQGSLHCGGKVRRLRSR